MVLFKEFLAKKAVVHNENRIEGKKYYCVSVVALGEEFLREVIELIEMKKQGFVIQSGWILSLREKVVVCLDEETVRKRLGMM